MRLLKSTFFLLLGLAFVGLSACHEKSTNLQAQPVSHAKQGKPGAAIKIVSSSILFVKANQVVETELVFDVNDSSGELTLELSSPKELDLFDSVLRIDIDLDGPKSIKIPVKFRAVQNGRFYLNIHAHVNKSDSSLTRNIAVIVQVGEDTERSVQHKTSSRLEKTAGEQIISMPAQETISPN